jgi:hypothetical protein
MFCAKKVFFAQKSINPQKITIKKLNFSKISTYTALKIHRRQKKASTQFGSESW